MRGGQVPPRTPASSACPPRKPLIMQCFHPLTGYRNPENGTISFTDNNVSKLETTVRCGQCIGCRIERSRQWAIRMYHESKLHERNCIITLTYADKNLPTGWCDACCKFHCYDLCVRDWQLFAKRLRKRYGRFRFFCGAEYTPEEWRPHFHVALFGLNFWEDRKYFGKSKSGYPMYVSEKLEAVWNKGFAPIGDFTPEYAQYIAKYIVDKVTGDPKKQIEHYGPRKPEFSTQSRKPGIGAEYYEKFKDQFYPRDEVIIDGSRQKPPSFYDRQLDDEEQSCLKHSRQERSRERRLLDPTCEDYWRKEQKEAVLIRRHILKKRGL